MANVITKHLNFTTFWNIISAIVVLATFLSLLFKKNPVDYLTDFNRGMITGVLLLFIFLIILQKLYGSKKYLKKLLKR